MELKCRECAQDLNPAWKVCPSCATPVALRCRECSAELDPAWRVCPFCSATITPNAPPAVAAPVRVQVPPAVPPPPPARQAPRDPRHGASPEDTWRLRFLFTSQAVGALAPILTANPTNVAEHLQARDPDTFLATAHGMLDQLSRLAQQPNIDEELRSGLRGLASHRDELLRPIARACEELRRHHAAVAALDLPDNDFEGFLAGAKQVLTADGSAAKGAIAGALLGNALLPGVGGFLGGALGGWLGGQQTQKKEAAIVQAFDAAWSVAIDSLQPAIDTAWNLATETAGRAGLPLHDSEFCSRAETAWSELAARLGETDAHPHPLHEEVRSFLTRWGPMKEPLLALLRISVPPYQAVDEATRQRNAIAQTLYSTDAEALEVVVEVAMADRQFERAARTATEAIGLHPTHIGLALTWIQALSAAGRDEEAEAAVRRFSPTVGTIVYPARAIGLSLADRHRDAGNVLRRWASLEPTWAVVSVEVLLDEATLAPVYTNQHAPTPTLADYVRGVVSMHLTSDPNRASLGLPRGNWSVQRVVAEHKPHDVVLYCYTGSDTDFLVITGSGILWSRRTEVGSLDFSAIDPASIGVDLNTLMVNGKQTAAFSPAATASAVGEVLRRVAQQLRR